MSSLQPLIDSPLFDLLVQSGKASDVQKAAAVGFSIAVVLAVLAFSLVFYVFFSFCMKRICQKAGHEPGILIWIPILQLIPQLTAAKLPVWFIVLFFIPFVNLVPLGILFWKLCEARGKPGPLGLLILVPFANLGLILYLAFAD
jgi:hypothetical protein